MHKLAVIGCGASGMIAALEACEQGLDVTVFEKKDRIGKKILVTGNGRCNFTNMQMSKDYYYSDDDDFVDNVLKTFGCSDLIRYMTSLGLLVKEKNGYCYPYSEQASSVLDVFRNALSEKNIKINIDSNVSKIEKTKKSFDIFLENGNKYFFDKVIVCCGGKSGLSKKECANGYDLLKNLGHSINRLYPALTQIRCEGLFFKALSGVRSDCSMMLFANEELLMTQKGEVLFTDYGVSGIVSFQLSHCAAKMLSENKKVLLVVDLLPGVDEEYLKNFISTKCLLHDNLTLEELCSGIHNKKLNIEIIKLCGYKPSDKVSNLSLDEINGIALKYKEFVIEAVGVNDFDQSQVTAGGVPLSEVSLSLESKIVPGLFITGELLDVDGLCGGYNLQWAFSTGYIAGRSAGRM